MGILSSTYGGGSGQTPSPGAARRPSGGGGGGGRGGNVSDATKNAVRTMQQLMGKLNTDMQTGNAAESALERIKAANGGTAPEAFDTSDKIKAAVRSWGATSAGGTTGSYDGIWGRNTKGVLENIKKFIADIKLPGMIIQEGTGNSPYHDMSSEDLKKIAEDNIANLARLFESLGMSAPALPGGGSGNLSSFPLDRIKAELTTDDATAPQPWPNHAGDIRVTVGDMRSLVRFFQFIQQLKYTPCRPLEGADRGREERGDRGSVDDTDIAALADLILDGSLIRLAQTATERSARGQSSGEAAARSYNADRARREQARETDAHRSADESARAASSAGNNKPVDDTPTSHSATESAGQWHCFYTVDEIFRWFASRARMVLTQVQDLIAERKPHPFYPDRMVNAQDEAAATAYLAAANGLWEQWSAMKGDVLRQIKHKGPEAADHPQVTLDMIMQGGAGDLPTPGAGRRRVEVEGDGRRGRGGRGSSAETISGGGDDSIDQRSKNGPIKEFMPLNWLLQDGTFRTDSEGSLADLSRGRRLPDIHRQIWRGGNWINIALNSIDGRGNTEKLQKFPQWAGLVRDVLYELYANWEEDNRSDLDERVIAQQNRELNRWGDVITSIITRAQSGMAEAVSRYGERSESRPTRR